MKIASQVMLGTGGEVQFYFEASPVEEAYLKAHLHARPAGAKFVISARDVDREEFGKYVFAFGAEVAPEVYAAIDGKCDSTSLFSLSGAPDADISHLNLEGFHVDLLPFQRAGVLYGYLAKKALIADEMGLGKTYQALGVLYAARALRFIVACPNSVKIGWQRSIQAAYGPDFPVAVWTSKGGEERTSAIIINYENLYKLRNQLGTFGPQAVIFDESHRLKTRNIKTTEAAFLIANRAEYILHLTGTPILNRPEEITTSLEMLGHLGAFGGWYNFVRKYCAAYRRSIWVNSKRGRFKKQILDTSGASNLQDLNERLRAACMVRRLKKEVLKDLPPKRRAQVVLEIDNRTEYRKAESNFLAYVKAAAAENKAFLATIAHLPADEQKAQIKEFQQEAGKTAEKAEQLVMMNTLARLAADGKVAQIVKWVEDFLESGQKFLLFAIHRDIQERLDRHFKGARIFADDKDVVRQANIDRFRDDPECRVMVASLGAGGTGVDTLQIGCDSLGFVEMPDVPAVCLQAEDRLWRMLQERPVTAYYFVAEQTIEEKIQARLAQKQAVCDAALDGAEETAHGSVFNELLDAMLLPLLEGSTEV